MFHTYGNILQKLRCIKSQSIHDVQVIRWKLANMVLSGLMAEQIIGPRLMKVTPFLSCDIVISVLQSLTQSIVDTRVFFRFFVWTTGHPKFQSIDSCNVTVDMLMEDKNLNSFDLYWNVLDEFKDMKMRFSSDAFLVLMLGYQRLRNVEKLVETFGRMKDYDCKPNRIIYNVLLNALGKKELVLLSLAVFNLMLKSNISLNLGTYKALFVVLSKCGRIEDVATLLKDMTARAISPDVTLYTTIISGLCKANNPLKAYWVFNRMHRDGCTPDLAAFNALLDGFCKCGMIDRAFSLMNTMKKRFPNGGLRGVSSLVDGLIRANRFDEAEDYFRGAIEEGLEPDIILYTIMIRGLSNAGKIRDAMKMLNDMKAKGVKPDTHCYNTVIKGLCDQGLFDEAKSLKDEISEHNEFPNTFTYTILMCALCRNGQLDDAQQIFNDMERLGCPPSSATFNALIDGFCKAGELVKARSTLHMMETPPSTILRLFHGSEPVHDTASLYNWVEKMVSSGKILNAYKEIQKLSSWAAPDTRTYNILIDGLCKAGEVNQALRFLDFQQHKGFTPDSVTYATLIYGLLMDDRETDALKLLERMKEGGCKPESDVYRTFMTWASKGKTLSAVFDYWLRYLRTLPHSEVSLRSIEECFSKGNIEEAFRSIIEISVDFFDFDAGPCNIFLLCLCETSMVEEAFNAFSILEEFKVPVFPPGCVRLIDALCTRRKHEDAVHVVLYMMQKGYKLGHEFECVLQLLYSCAHVNMALELVDRMISTGYDMNTFVSLETRVLLGIEDVRADMIQDDGLP